MIRFTSLLLFVGLTVPASAATISLDNWLELTFSQVADVTVVKKTDTVTVDFQKSEFGPNVSPSGFAGADGTATDGIFSRNFLNLTVGPASQYSFEILAISSTLTFRNSGRVEAVVPLNFLLVLKGLAGGPDTAQFGARSRIQTRSGANDWTSILDFVIDVNSDGPTKSVDYCSASQLCEGPLSLTVGAGESVMVRTISTAEGFASQGEVPEPSAMVLAGAGLGFVVWLRRRR